MEILLNIEEDRNWDNPQQNKNLIHLMGYLNSLKLKDQSSFSNKKDVEIYFIRRFRIFELDGEIIYEIRYDGTSAIGKGKGITRTIPPERMKPYERIMKFNNINKRWDLTKKKV